MDDAQKALLFEDEEVYQQIIEASKPGNAKELGRHIRNFDQQVWDENKLEIVVKGNLHKFSQDPDLSDFLIKTNNRILVEASPLDTIWGIGLSQDDRNVYNPKCWNGLNLLGFAIMEVRDILSNQSIL